MENENSKKVQEILNKFISEEVIAHDFYIGCLMAMKIDDRPSVRKLFCDIAEDEMNDHCRKLADFAEQNGYTVPFKYNEYEKYAASKVFNLFKRIKRDEKLKYYFEEAVTAEEEAIKQYEDALKTPLEDLPYDLYSILLQNYYDELEHLRDLTSLKDAIKQGAKFNIY